MFLKLARILIMKGESIMVLCNVLKSILVVSVAGIAIAVIVPVFVADQFRTGGESMSPVLETGDHILVDKLLMGARIYTAYDFTVPELKSFRTGRCGGLQLSGRLGEEQDRVPYQLCIYQEMHWLPRRYSPYREWFLSQQQLSG